MSEIDDYEEQFLELIEQVKGILEQELPRMRGQERVEKCSYLKNRLARAKQIHRSILVEIRDLTSERTPEWEQKAREYDAQISKLLQDVEWAETSAEKDDIKRR
ncbi:hypothetical protein BDK51DRAFT_27875, partial [Blyttiomyces helicus]